MLESSPYCSVLYTEYMDVICNFCYTRPTLHTRLVCKDCEILTYCSRKCLEQDRECHSLECAQLSESGCQPSSATAWLLMRVWLRSSSERGKEEGEKVPDKKTNRIFHDLLSHEEDIRKNRKFMENIQEHYDDLQQVMSPETLPDFCDFVTLYGRVVINNFELITTTSDQESLGLALYLTPSLVDHSCEPNAWVEIRGRKLLLRTIEDRERLDLSKVLISYVDTDEQRTQVRRDYLQRHYFFTCQCERCKN